MASWNTFAVKELLGITTNPETLIVTKRFTYFSARGSLKEAWNTVRAACDPKFADYSIYEHCLPFNVARAYDEARGIDTPRIWTADRDRDRQMWDQLQG